MSEKTPLRGSCMCGKIAFTANQTAAPHACHCQMCRKHQGTAFHSVPCGDFAVKQGAEHLKTYATSGWAHRGFCDACGTGLFYCTNNGEFRGVSLGCLETTKPSLSGHIYTDCADVNVKSEPDFWDDLPKTPAQEFLNSIGLGQLYDHHSPAIADMTGKKHHGGCSCGNVQFHIDGKLSPILICHCGQCQQQSSSYYRATNVANEHLHLDKSDGLVWHQSSDMAERGFCKDCGSKLFWRGKETRRPDTDITKFTAILLGAFNERLPLPLEAHIFTEDASGAFPLPKEIS